MWRILLILTFWSCGTGLIGEPSTHVPEEERPSDLDPRIPADWDGTVDWVDSALEVVP